MEIFLRRGLDRKFSVLPVGQQIAGWVEPFAKPIVLVENMMVPLPLHPSYALVHLEE
jgi:hypothetical protein